MNTSSRAGHDRSHSPEMTESPHRLPTQEQLLEKMVTWHGEMLSQMAHSNEMLRKLISSARDSDDLQDLEYGLRRVETGQSMRQGSGKGGLDRGCRRRWFDSDEEDEWYSSPRGKSRVLRMSNRGFKEGEADIHGRRMKRRGTGQSYPDYTSESDDSSRGTSSSSSMSNVFYGENVFSREEMDALMKKEYPGVKEYKEYFASKLPVGQKPAIVGTIDWQSAIVQGLNASAPSRHKNNLLTVELLDEHSTELMCSLYGSEKTHPTMGQDTQYRFELMHAPRLYEFLESTIAPYAWRSSDIISPWHDTVENFGWDEGLKILAQTGLAMQRAQDVPELEKGGVSNFTVIDRFELILANQCMKTGLVPEKFDGQGRYKWRINLRHESLFWLGERFNRDYVNDEPGISNPPSLAQLVKLGDQYHGFTYVPRPDPKGRRPMIYDQDEKKFLLPEPRRLAAEFSPASLALQSVQRISKDWNVMWTSNLAEHLWVDDRIIYVFWCPTLLAHQPRGAKTLTLTELLKTYAHIFGSIEPKHRQQQETIARAAGKYSVGGRPLRPSSMRERDQTELSHRTEPVRSLLRTWLDAPAPHHIAGIFAAKRLAASEKGWIPIREVLDVAVDEQGGYYPEDLLLMMQGILAYGHKHNLDTYNKYPYFSERMKYLGYVLEKQKPRGLRELWKDQRDSLQWWTFWLVVWFGIVSVLLALFSLVTGVVQTVAAFRALKQGS